MTTVRFFAGEPDEFGEPDGTCFGTFRGEVAVPRSGEEVYLFTDSGSTEYVVDRVIWAIDQRGGGGDGHHSVDVMLVSPPGPSPLPTGTG